MVRWLAFLLLLLVAAGGYLLYGLTREYAGFKTETFLDIPKGTGTVAMADMLQQAGVIQSSWQFVLARALHPGATLQAGEYRFNKPASTLEVFSRIARGDVFYYVLVVPEGKNIFDIAALVANLGLISQDTFLRAARDPSFIRDLDPQAPSLEGYLFPDTYHFTRHTSVEGLCRLMTGRFRQAWRDLKTPADVHNTVTLASLIEKEAELPHERPVIASVFRNRLKIGMKLDCDPTTVYAAILAGRYRGAIFKSDLQSNSSYNTYRHAGLPPGPIANPGIDSLKAALNPAETNYLYFVALPDRSGGHSFSDTYAAHQEAASRYRRSNQN